LQLVVLRGGGKMIATGCFTRWGQNDCNWLFYAVAAKWLQLVVLRGGGKMIATGCFTRWGQNDCNWLFYVTSENVFDDFKVF